MRQLLVLAFGTVLLVGCNKPGPTAAPLGDVSGVVAAAVATPKSGKVSAPGAGIADITLSVPAGRKNAWRADVTAVAGKAFVLKSLVGESRPASLPSEWFDVASGPLAGNVVHLPGYIGSIGTPGVPPRVAEVYAPGHFLTQDFGFQDKEVMAWACSTGRGGVKGGKNLSEFREECDRIATSKRKTDAFSAWNSSGVLVAIDCDLAMMGKGAKCTYSAKSGRTNVE